MGATSDIREYAHELIDRMDLGRVQALLNLLDEDYFSGGEVDEIKQLRASGEWTDWRGLRDDV